ncbi:MAG: pantetheine-phosphate adenylyltransferase [Candidatus Wallbacteria bacterium]|nr:pantetheine-phosphate adenylyltransferase [Candidatus Wallbacteria bacterium]
MDITAIYPGSFDPATLGHLDIIERASKLFARVVVAISESSNTKRFAFTEEKRLEMLEKIVKPFPNVSVTTFGGLLTSFARSRGSAVLVRGLRAISDFEYEFQMASMNRYLAQEIETVFMMTSPKYHYLSSSIVKEIARLQGDISGLVPPELAEDVRARFCGP